MPKGDRELIFFNKKPDKMNFGIWWGGRTKDGEKTAFVICFDCGGIIPLLEYEIYPDGHVFPPVKCPHKGCSFDDQIALNDWEI